MTISATAVLFDLLAFAVDDVPEIDHQIDASSTSAIAIAIELLVLVVVTTTTTTGPLVVPKCLKGVFRGLQRMAVIPRGSPVGKSVRNRGVLDVGNDSDGEEEW